MSLQVHAGCVPKLIAVATSGSQEAALEATGALAMLSSTVSGKETLAQHGVAAVLFRLLTGNDDMLLQRNVLNIISSAAENPEMRQQLTVRFHVFLACVYGFVGKRVSDMCMLQDAGVMEVLSRRQDGASDTVNRAVKTALQQCAFKHRPTAAPCIQDSDVYA